VIKAGQGAESVWRGGDPDRFRVLWGASSGAVEVADGPLADCPAYPRLPRSVAVRELAEVLPQAAVVRADEDYD
jgi:hypothetical protein